MNNRDSNFTTEQQIQEDQYTLPYHYFIDRFSFGGIFYSSYVDKCVEVVESFQGKKILDVGCGDAFFLSQLNDKKNHLYGIDYSKRALDFAKLFNQGKALELVQGAWEEIPFEDNYFDIVTSIAVLEHIKPENIHICLKEAYRILRDTGLLILAIPTHNLKKPKKHFRHFRLDEIKQIIEPLFIIEKVYGRYNKLFQFIYRFFDNRIYDIKPLSKIMREKVFYNYFSSSPIKSAKMLVLVLAKKRG